MARPEENRPFKYGAMNRREFIVQDSEVALRCINNTSGNPIYMGRALVGTLESEQKWQIRFIEYDSSEGVVSVTWPENDAGAASANYEFVWDDATTLSITAITQANPAVVTVSSAGSLANGRQIVIQGVSGMTEVNFDGSNIYTVANLVGTSFELQGVDSSAFTAYSSGGTVEYGDVVNYTYS